MDLGQLDNSYFDNRASAVLTYFLIASRKAKGQPFSFTLENDPFEMVYYSYDEKLFAHIKVDNISTVREHFEIASINHTEKLLKVIEDSYKGYELHDGKLLTLDQFLYKWIFEDEYLLYGLETYATSKNKSIFDMVGHNFDIDEVEGIQSSTNDVIGSITVAHELATGLNNPSKEVISGLKLITEYVQNENANEQDFKQLENELNRLKSSYNNK